MNLMATMAVPPSEHSTQAERLSYLRSVIRTFNLTVEDIAKHTGYSASSVHGWLSPPESARNRMIPGRAVRLLAAEISSGAVTRR